jgi:mRNA interferase MazF
MKHAELKVTRIGNSRGVRLPATTLARYDIGEAVAMEERSDGILLRPIKRAPVKLSWEETAREMATVPEDLSGWDTTLADGLDDIPWDEAWPMKISESKPSGKQSRVRRYEVRWAALDPVRGSEIAKTRPVVIVSLDQLNDVLETVTVCAMTTQLHPTWRTRLGINIGGRNAEIAVDQIRTISKSRLTRQIGRLTEREASALRRLITELYGE